MLIVQNVVQPATIRNAIVDLLAPDIIDIRIASAYVTLTGSNILFQALLDSVGQPRLMAIPKILVTSFDFGLTDPQALRQWIGLPNAAVFVSGAQRVEHGSLSPLHAFHPKMYSFGRDQHTCGALIGSANLTSRGFSVNTEAAWSQHSVQRFVIDNAINYALYGTVQLTESLLATYESLRRLQPPPPEMVRETQPVEAPEPIIGNALPAFRIAIENGQVDPAMFGAMWVQGEALQGGSANQLELPRGAHRFFGFNFNQYDYPDKLTIGQPILRSGARVWTDRLLTWHGNNKMERMNLPTVTQGGFDYANTAVMFRRLANLSFELIVTPWDSDLARSWRQASANRQTLFRLGTVATNRLVGLI